LVAVVISKTNLITNEEAASAGATARTVEELVLRSPHAAAKSVEISS
jgi:hypothetical protein